MCSSGHSCPIGTPVEMPCEPGTYSSAPGAAYCLSCPSGTMCPSSATQEPTPCPKGILSSSLKHTFYEFNVAFLFLFNFFFHQVIFVLLALLCHCHALQAVWARLPGLNLSLPVCPVHLASTAVFLDPLSHKVFLCLYMKQISALAGLLKYQYMNKIIQLCPRNVFLYAIGQCQAGYFCQSGSAYPAPLNTSSIMRNGPCPQGHFCPSGTLTPLPCPAGTIRDLTGV